MKLSLNEAYGLALCASWLYYHKPCMDPILTDAQFDRYCKVLHDNWNNPKFNHKYKSLVTKESLAAGSFYHIGSYAYPRGLIDCAEKLSLGIVKIEDFH